MKIGHYFWFTIISATNRCIWYIAQCTISIEISHFHFHFFVCLNFQVFQFSIFFLTLHPLNSTCFVSYGNKYRSMCVYASTIDIFISVNVICLCVRVFINIHIYSIHVCVCVLFLCVCAYMRISHEHTEKKSLVFVAGIEYMLNTV